jgi:hypothetical protein
MLGDLALKVWGLALLIGALTALPAGLAVFKTISGGDPQAAMFRTTEVVAIVNLVFHAVVGGAVIVWSERIVNFIIAEEAPLEIELSMADLLPLTFGIVGIFVLIDGLRNVAGSAYALFTKPKFVESTLEFAWERQYESIARAVPQLAAGIFLIVGRDSIAQWWSRPRSGAMTVNFTAH